MRASLFLVIAVLIAGLLALDAYEYDGHYSKAALDEVEHLIGR
jgi:hypothetical protein